MNLIAIRVQFIQFQMVFLGDIVEKWLRSMLPFCLSVCLSVCHVRALCPTAEVINVFSYAYDIPMSFSDHAKIWLTSADILLLKFCPKVTHPCWFECQSHSMANCCQMYRDSAMVTWRTYRKSPSLFQTVPSLTPTNFPSPKLGSHMHLARPSSRCMRIRQKIWQGFFCMRCRLLPNYFGLRYIMNMTFAPWLSSLKIP